MEINSRQTYTASPDQVFSMMTDPAYLNALCDRFGVTERTVTVEGNTSTVRMAMPAPSQVQKFVGASMPMTQVITWGEPAADGSRTGTLTMNVEKMPVDARGTATLRPTPSGTTEVTYQMDMNVKIPLVGKKLEKEAAPMVQKVFDAQQSVGEQYLSQQG